MERLSDPLLAPGETPRLGYWKWLVCGLLFLATMLMYMDRQTLSQSIVTIQQKTGLTDPQYGLLEQDFSYAFAAGSILLGIIADRVNVRWFYPLVLMGWSAAGVASAYSPQIGHLAWQIFPSHSPDRLQPTTVEATYTGMWICRVALGFFEAGHWPCGLITTKRLLAASDRNLGNSLMQSGGMVGAVLTPLVIKCFRVYYPDNWQLPFVAIGIVGTLWVLPWLLMVRGRDLLTAEKSPTSAKQSSVGTSGISSDTALAFVVILVVVSCINVNWQFFRVWIPKMLEQKHGYSKGFVENFSMVFFLMADVGCMTAGATSKMMTRQKWSVHSSRVLVFFAASLLTCASGVAAFLPPGNAFLGCILLAGMGSLGLFPTYYSLSQELSARYPGTVGGLLGAIAWIVVGNGQRLVVLSLEKTGSYSLALIVVGLIPLVACAALLFWKKDDQPSAVEA